MTISRQFWSRYLCFFTGLRPGTGVVNAVDRGEGQLKVINDLQLARIGPGLIPVSAMVWV